MNLELPSERFSIPRNVGTAATCVRMFIYRWVCVNIHILMGDLAEQPGLEGDH